jgi:hypothetical protein
MSPFIIVKENPGAVRPAAGARTDSWFGSHDLQHPIGGSQVVF